MPVLILLSRGLGFGSVTALAMSAGLPYGRWLRFAIPGALLVAVIGAIGVVLSA